MEIEMKLVLAEPDVATFRALPLLAELAPQGPRTAQWISVYFDTPERALACAGAALRMRKTDGGWVQTLKTGGDAAGSLRRGEFEAEVPGARPDLSLLRSLGGLGPALEALFHTEALETQLGPVFTTRVTRSSWLVRFGGGSDGNPVIEDAVAAEADAQAGDDGEALVEVSLDLGAVERGDVSVPFREVELALKSGDATRLYDLAQQLIERVPMRLGRLSKADRGYALMTGANPPVVRAQPLKLARRATVEDAFRQIVDNCLAQIQGNEAGVRAAHDPANVHQMRVGVRRLRSAFDLVRAHLETPRALRDEWRWLAAELGGARDWEVFCSTTLPEVTRAAPHDLDTAPLTQAAQARAASGRDLAVATLDTPRYDRLMLAFGRWFHSAGWRRDQDEAALRRLHTPLKKFAGSAIADLHRKLVKRGHKLAELTPAARHRARIAAKKLRYAIEFFQSLHDQAEVRHSVKVLARLQDDLGWHNDLRVADGLLRELRETHAGLDECTGFARGVLAARAISDQKKQGRLWQRFVDTPMLH